MKKTHLHILLNRFFGKDFPDEMRDRFGAWFIRPEQTVDKEEVLEDIWNSLPETIDFSSYVELEKINKRIHARSNTLYRRCAVAVAIILLPLLGVFTTTSYYNWKGFTEEVQMLECFVPNGEQKQLTLPDGSVVWLNAGSTLLYPETFGKTRSIYLSGEGHFTVVKNKEKPFIVKTSYIDVEALGTVFNVHAYSEETKSTTTLETGMVRVDDRKGISRSVILNPNEQLIYNHADASFEKIKVDASRLNSWTGGYLVFQQEPLGSIFRSLERRYNVKINYNDSKFGHMTFTLRFSRDESLKEAMEVLKRLGLNFNYKIINKDVFIQ